MQKKQQTHLGRIFGFLALAGFGLFLQPSLKADVVILQTGTVITGNVLQQDGDGVLLQMESGTFRFPPASVRDVKKEAAAAPHASNNGQRIPDWAQIVSLLANNGWAQGLKQVPAAVINHGVWGNVPYISFRCASGGYEINVFGDLNRPAGIQIGAMSYLSQSTGAKSNCVNFICSVLANADDRKMIRALNLNQKDLEKKGGMTFETILPGEWGSYGGWWVSVYNDNDLANSHASEAELLGLVQPRVATPPPVAATAQPAATTTNVAAQSEVASSQPAPPPAQPVTTTTGSGVVTTYGATYGEYPGWTAEELAAARPVASAPYPAATADKPASTGDQAYPSTTADKVYPRTYDRA
ncbi:MAG: hypothetical protein ABSF60_11255, partial [Verrucomicrobiota bacterium]